MLRHRAFLLSRGLLHCRWLLLELPGLLLLLLTRLLLRITLLLLLLLLLLLGWSRGLRLALEWVCLLRRSWRVLELCRGLLRLLCG